MTNEEFERDLDDAIDHYGDYGVVELRKEAEQMEELARSTTNEKQQDDYRRQAYLMNLMLFTLGVRR